jgi:hypothetical protein
LKSRQPKQSKTKKKQLGPKQKAAKRRRKDEQKIQQEIDSISQQQTSSKMQSIFWDFDKPIPDYSTEEDTPFDNLPPFDDLPPLEDDSEE